MNTAMNDALELAYAIIASPSDLDKAVQTYERRLFPRSKKVQNITWEELLHTFDLRGAERWAGRPNYLLHVREKGIPVAEELGADNNELG